MQKDNMALNECVCVHFYFSAIITRLDLLFVSVQISENKYPHSSEFSSLMAQTDVLTAQHPRYYISVYPVEMT